MRCLIIDDEAPARWELSQLLHKYPEIKIVGEAGNVETALQLTASHSPDLVFIDVELRGETGFDYVDALQNPYPHLVFVTAFDQYAVRGFEYAAIDYLVKPVHPERLAESLRRALPHPVAPGDAADKLLFIREKEKASKSVPWNTVSHILSEGNYSRVIFTNSSNALILRPLKEWFSIAPPGHLCQVHRTALIARTAIKEIRGLPSGGREVRLGNGSAIPIGRAYWPHLQKLMNIKP